MSALRHMTVLSLGVALIACGAPADTGSGAESASASALGARFGGCDSENVDVESPDSTLGTVVKWYRVGSVPAEADELGRADRGHTATLSMHVAPVSSPSVVEGDFEDVEFRIHTSYLPGIEWALETAGATAYVGHQAQRTSDVSANLPGMVTVVAIATPNGDYFFPGYCQDIALRAPLARRLGLELSSWLSGVIGRTGSDLDAALLDEAEPSTTRVKQPIVSNLSAKEIEAAGLVPVEVSLAWPSEWSSDANLLCARVSTGFTGCWSMSLDASEPVQGPPLYAVPGETIELWLVRRGFETLETFSGDLLGEVPVDTSIAPYDSAIVHLDGVLANKNGRTEVLSSSARLTDDWGPSRRG